MALVLQLLVAGISLGGIYALFSFSFSLVISTTMVLNIAHGVFVVWGAGIIAVLLLRLKLSPFLAVPVVVLFFVGFGFFFYWGIVRTLMKRGSHFLLSGSILATYGLALAMESGLGTAWMTFVDASPTFLLPFTLPSLKILGTSLSGNRLVILFLAVLMILGFYLFLRKTFLGRSARAMAQSIDGFLIIGLNPERTASLIVILAVVVAALAGILYILAIPLNPFEGLPLTLKALTVIILAGVESLPGILAASALLGLAEVIGSYFLGSVWAPVIGYAILFLVLLIRPTGLFGKGIA
jgi:branched-chain amino acid transport system permease protein